MFVNYYKGENIGIKNNKKDSISYDFLVGKNIMNTGFLYKNSGISLYEKILKEKSYKKIYQEGKKIIRNNKNVLKKYLGDIIIDYGCGNGDKAKELLKGFNKKIKYQAIDVDNISIDKANDNILSLNNHNILISKGKKALELNTIGNVKIGNNKCTFFFTGGSIGNYNDNEIKKLLSSTLKPKSGSIIIDYFSAPKSIEDILFLIKCYNNQATEKWFNHGLKNLGLPNSFKESKRGLKTNFRDFEIDDFLHYTVFYEFEDNLGNAYYIELKNDNTYNIFKFDGNKRVQCKTTPKLKQYPGKIIEGYIAIKDSSLNINIVNGIGHYENVKLEMAGTLNINKQKDFIVKFKKNKFYPIEISRRFSDDEIKSFFITAGWEKHNIKILGGDKGKKFMKIAIATI